MAKEETVTMTAEQFNSAIGAAAAAAAQAVLAAQPAAAPAATLDDQVRAFARDRHGASNPPHPTTTVKNCSGVSGSTFDAKIDHNNNVISLENYTHPDGVDKVVTDGGLVPAGFTIAEPNNSKYKQWKWFEFWQADINAFVGKPLARHVLDAAKAATARAEKASGS